MITPNSIHCIDVIEGLRQIQSDTITLLITSPPYNVGIKEYSDTQDDLPYFNYIDWLANIFKESYRVLRIGGRCIINIDAMMNRQEDKEQEYIRDIRTDLAIRLKNIGYKFFGEHIWWKNGQWNGKKTAWGSYCNCSFPAVRRSYEYVLVYSKEQFRLEKNSESGEADITAEEFQKYIDSFWAIQPETRNLGSHPVPFPLGLPLRCIKLYSYTNDIILDCFSGVGTTCLAAKIAKRRYIGLDISQEYCDYAKNRLSVEIDLFEQEL